MAETNVQTKILSAQDTGNPVLDSTVNFCASQTIFDPDVIETVHAIMLKVAPLEPGGLKRRRETVSSESRETERPTAEELQRRSVR